jgi:hypothetical protein
MSKRLLSLASLSNPLASSNMGVDAAEAIELNVNRLEVVALCRLRWIGSISLLMPFGINAFD